MTPTLTPGFRVNGASGGATTLPSVKPSPVFPAAIATDSDLLIGGNRVITMLTQGIGPNDTTITVADGSLIQLNMTLSLGRNGEIVKVIGPGVGLTYPVQRGFDQTVPTSHPPGDLVLGNIIAWHHNALVSEIEAIEAALGPNLDNIANARANTYVASDYNFAQPALGRVLSIGSNTITLAPIPATLRVGDWLCIDGGVGTNEAVQIQGWNQATGQVIFNCVSAHSGAWTIGSASSGIQEAMNTAVLGSNVGGTVVLNAGIMPLCGTINLRTGCHLVGFGPYITILQRTGDYGDTFYGLQQNSMGFQWFTVQQYVNYQPGTPGTAINIPTRGAHFNLVGCNTMGFYFVRIETAVTNVRIEGGADIDFYSCQFYGIYDGRPGSPQITNSNVLIVSSTAMGIPTWIGFYGCIHVGNNNGTANSPTNYSGVGAAFGYNIQGCEDLEVIGGSIGGCNLNNFLFEPTASTIVLANIRLTAIKFDSAGNGDVTFASGSTAHNAAAITISSCIFNGEYAGKNGLLILNAGSGPPLVSGLVVDNNLFFAYIYSPIRIEDGQGIKINNNFIYNYNTAASTNPELACGIWLGQRAAGYFINNNVLGGGPNLENYNGTTNNCLYGIFAPSSAGLDSNTTPTPNSLGTLNDLVYSKSARSSIFANIVPLPQPGAYAFVTDSTVNTFGATIAGGGTNQVFAIFNGTNWTVAGA